MLILRNKSTHLQILYPYQPKPEKPRFAKKSAAHTQQASLRKLFSWFFLDEKASLKGIALFGVKQSVCLHTSRLTTNGVNTLTSVSFSARGFSGFGGSSSPK